MATYYKDLFRSYLSTATVSIPVEKATAVALRHILDNASGDIKISLEDLGYEERNLVVSTRLKLDLNEKKEEEYIVKVEEKEEEDILSEEELELWDYDEFEDFEDYEDFEEEKITDWEKLSRRFELNSRGI